MSLLKGQGYQLHLNHFQVDPSISSYLKFILGLLFFCFYIYFNAITKAITKPFSTKSIPTISIQLNTFQSPQFSLFIYQTYQSAFIYTVIQSQQTQMMLRKTNTKILPLPDIQLTAFQLKSNSLTISIRSNDETYQVSKILDPDLDVNDIKNDLQAKRFSILPHEPETIKIKVGYLYLLFKKINLLIPDKIQQKPQFLVEQEKDSTIEIQSLAHQVKQNSESISHLSSNINEILRSISSLSQRLGSIENYCKQNNEYEGNQMKERVDNQKKEQKTMKTMNDDNQDKKIKELKMQNLKQREQVMKKVKQIIEKDSKRREKQQKRESIGFAILKAGITKKSRAWLIGNEKKKRLNTSSWNFYLSSDQTQDLNWIQLFRSIDLVTCSELRISSYKERELVIDTMLGVPVYQNLVCLNLRDCQICSIQKLQFINLQIIQKLQIRGNQLINVQPLYKLYVKSLKELSICQRTLKQVKYGRIKLNKTTKTVLFDSIFGQVYSSEDLSEILKLQSLSMESQMQIAKQLRINQAKVMSVIVKKFVKKQENQ